MSAIRGASSKRKKTSFYAVRSASQELLSVRREEKKEEKKAQSMDNLDGNCESDIFLKREINFITLIITVIFLVLDLLLSLVYTSSKQPDLLPRPAVSFEPPKHDEKDFDNR